MNECLFVFYYSIKYLFFSFLRIIFISQNEFREEEPVSNRLYCAFEDHRVKISTIDRINF